MRWLSFVIALGLALESGLAGADDARAKQHFAAGLKAYNLQRFDTALNEFQAAYLERADPAFLFNIAQCQRQLDQPVAAAKSYRAYLAQQPDAPNRDEVLQRIDEMDKAAAEQKATRERAARSAAAATPPVASTPKTASTPALVATPPPPRSHAMRNAAIGLGAGGLVVLGLGGAFAGLAKSAGDAAYHRNAYDYSADGRYHGYQSAEIASFVVGGAALATGVILFALDRHARPR